MQGNHLVDVFPITTAAFGFSPNWFERYVPQLIHPSFLLMVLLLVVAIGIMALRRFEDSDLEKKLWNIPVIILVITIWPTFVLGLKDLVDAFDTFLARSVFGITWVGFGFHAPTNAGELIKWPAEALARLLPNFTYWIIYAFYLIFFFLYAVLGPLIIAKGILSDEIDNLLGLITEIVTLFLWQTMVVILVGFILPDIVAGIPLPPQPENNVYFLAILLSLMILFVPSMTRKFVIHLGYAIFPPGTRMGAAFLGLGLVGKIGGAGLSAVGVKHIPTLETARHTLLRAEEFTSRYRDRRHIQDTELIKFRLEDELRKEAEHEAIQHEEMRRIESREEALEKKDKEKDEGLITLFKRAKKELKE